MNSSCTVDLGVNKMRPSLRGSLWQNSQEANLQPVFEVFHLPAGYKNFLARGSATSIPDPWLIEEVLHNAVVTVGTAPSRLLVRDLGWTREQTIETRHRLATFEEDWNAPGMEVYDDL